MENKSLNTITAEDVYSILLQILPKQNDFFETDYSEELDELLQFGITKKGDLENLLLKHRSDLLKIDSDDLDEFHIEYYTKEYGIEYVQDRVENKYWFAYSALLRIALELEFGEAYIKYADIRDNI